MAITKTKAPEIRGIVSSVPPRRFDNLTEKTAFDAQEVQKVVRLAGVKTRHVADESICSTDLCIAASRRLMSSIGWTPDSVDALIFVTQTPDYFLPSSCCIAHRALDLRDSCAAFDVGLGCSGYPYGLWLAASILQNPGIRRVLLLHGETPTRFADPSDRTVALLFGDAGSATAIESVEVPHNREWTFCMQTDGTGFRDLIIEGGGFRERVPKDQRKHFVSMNGPNIFNFTLKRVPTLIEDAMSGSGLSKEQIDYFIFHQSNQFIMRHLAKKTGLPEEKIPLVISEFGSAGGPSVPLTITQGGLSRPKDRPLQLLLLGYGVGLSWGSALVHLGSEAVLDHVILDGPDHQPRETERPELSSILKNDSRPNMHSKV